VKQVVTVCKGSRAMGKFIGIGIENKGNADMFNTDTDTEKNISGAFKA
jgi:hypothetical protein